MRFKEYLIEQSVPKPKKPSNKALWYNDYTHWVQDIKTRHPHAIAYKTDDDIVLALDDNNDKLCFGKWMNNDTKGIVYSNAKPVSIVISNRQKYKKVEDTTNMLKRRSSQAQ